jgi:hypothetical protein
MHPATYTTCLRQHAACTYTSSQWNQVNSPAYIGNMQPQLARRVSGRQHVTCEVMLCHQKQVTCSLTADNLIVFFLSQHSEVSLSAVSHVRLQVYVYVNLAAYPPDIYMYMSMWQHTFPQTFSCKCGCENSSIHSTRHLHVYVHVNLATYIPPDSHIAACKLFQSNWHAPYTRVTRVHTCHRYLHILSWHCSPGPACGNTGSMQ